MGLLRRKSKGFIVSWFLAALIGVLIAILLGMTILGLIPRFLNPLLGG